MGKVITCQFHKEKRNSILKEVGEFLEQIRNHYDKYEYFPVPWIYFQKTFIALSEEKQKELLKYFLDTPICQATHFLEEDEKSY